MKKSELKHLIKELLSELEIGNPTLEKYTEQMYQKINSIVKRMNYHQLENLLKHLKSPMKEDHDETDMSNPEENREVQIAKEIESSLEDLLTHEDDGVRASARNIQKFAKELLKMHGK